MVLLYLLDREARNHSANSLLVQTISETHLVYAYF